MSQAGRQEFVSAYVERALHGIISRHEAPLLAWLAVRLPHSIAPDHLTIVGVLGALLTAAGLIGSHIFHGFLWLALIGLALNWFGDSLDGTIARHRRIERPRYGFFVDHLADVLSQIVIVIGLGLSPFIRFDVVCLGLVAYLVLMVYTLVNLHVRRSMRLSYFGVGPTEVRVLIGLGVLMAASMDIPCALTSIGRLSLFDVAALVMIAFALGSTVIMFVRDVAQLATLDPPRQLAPAEVNMIEIPSSQALVDLERLRTAGLSLAAPCAIADVQKAVSA